MSVAGIRVERPDARHQLVKIRSQQPTIDGCNGILGKRHLGEVHDQLLGEPLPLFRGHGEPPLFLAVVVFNI